MVERSEGVALPAIDENQAVNHGFTAVQTHCGASRPLSLRGLRRKLMAERRAQRLEAAVSRREELSAQLAQLDGVPGALQQIAALSRLFREAVATEASLRQRFAAEGEEDRAPAAARIAARRRGRHGRGSSDNGSGSSLDREALQRDLNRDLHSLAVAPGEAPGVEGEQLPQQGPAAADAEADGELPPQGAAPAPCKDCHLLPHDERMSTL
ncbi:hypothetical protein ABPG75_008858 [Micractinium tetrahymenae]